MKDSHLTRLETSTWKPIYTSRVQIPSIDSIFEDRWGKVWVVGLGQQITILKFSNLLYLEETYCIPTDKSKLVLESTNPCVMDAKRETIYFPSGYALIQALKIKTSMSEDKSKKTADLKTVFSSLKRTLIFDMSLTSDDKRLLVDQGKRNIRVIDVETGDSFVEFLDNSKEQMSKPLCLSDPTMVLFSGITRSIPMISLFRLGKTSLDLLGSYEIEGGSALNGKEGVAGMILLPKSENQVDRIATITTLRRLFIFRVNPSKVKLEVEASLDLTYSQRYRIEMGVKSFHFGNNKLLFFTDNREKPTTRLSITLN